MSTVALHLTFTRDGDRKIMTNQGVFDSGSVLGKEMCRINIAVLK